MGPLGPQVKAREGPKGSERGKDGSGGGSWRGPKNAVSPSAEPSHGPAYQSILTILVIQ